MTYYPPTYPPRPTRRRGHTGLWAALTFFTLSAACLLALLIVATGGQLPDFGNGPSWTPPATAAPSAGQPGAVVQETVAPPPALGAFGPGDPVQNVSGGPVNLRRTPGFRSKPADDVLTTVRPGQTGVALEGPVEADGLRWWRVRFPVGEGWMAERSSSGKVLLDRAP
ncbi:MAG: hypothetical protein NZ528_02285 [Caldilineales bacterium]|nr:hypothetical protein [Caldilineales bacterium]MDW8318188.1 hypothetical protein [Anaerolineae bacterium]